MSYTIYTGRVGREPFDAAVGTTQLYAAVAGRELVLLSFTVTADATQGGSTFTLNTASGAVIGGPFRLGANGQLPTAANPFGHCNTLNGEAMNIIVTAGRVSGMVTVQEVKDAN